MSYNRIIYGGGDGIDQEVDLYTSAQREALSSTNPALVPSQTLKARDPQKFIKSVNDNWNILKVNPSCTVSPTATISTICRTNPGCCPLLTEKDKTIAAELASLNCELVLRDGVFACPLAQGQLKQGDAQAMSDTSGPSYFM